MRSYSLTFGRVADTLHLMATHEKEGMRESRERETLRDAAQGNSVSTLAPMSAMLTGRRWRFAARWIGLLIFFGGAGLIGFVFVKAFEGFRNFSEPNYIQFQLNKIGGNSTMDMTIAALSVLGGELMKLLYLLLLGYLGSLISAKGIQLFAASESVIDEAVVGNREE